jgi:hypothetical protein
MFELANAGRRVFVSELEEDLKSSEAFFSEISSNEESVDVGDGNLKSLALPTSESHGNRAFEL